MKVNKQILKIKKKKRPRLGRMGWTPKTKQKRKSNQHRNPEGGRLAPKTTSHESNVCQCSSRRSSSSSSRRSRQQKKEAKTGKIPTQGRRATASRARRARRKAPASSSQISPHIAQGTCPSRGHATATARAGETRSLRTDFG